MGKNDLHGRFDDMVEAVLAPPPEQVPPKPSSKTPQKKQSPRPTAKRKSVRNKKA